MKILIDYGHGEDTPGKRSPWSGKKVPPELDFYEWSWNREIGKEILARLNALGFTALEVVPEDKDVALVERVRRVNDVSGDKILISIHSNAAGYGTSWLKARGWSCYTTKGETKSDILAEFLYSEADKRFKDLPGIKIRRDKSDGDSDWEAGFYILRYTNCPAVLSENFFYDNPDDCRFILSPAGKEAIISLHVDGIRRYIEKEEEK